MFCFCSENHSQALVSAYGCLAFGRHQDSIRRPSLPLQEAHGCHQECENAGPAATLPSAFYRRETGTKNDNSEADWLLSRRNTAVCILAELAKLFSDLELEVEIFDLTVQCDDQK